MQANNPEPFVPIDEVAKHFSVSVSTIRAWLRNGQIPSDTYIKVGNTYRFRLGAITTAILSQSEESPAEETVPQQDEPITETEDDLSDLDLDDL